MAEMDDNTGWSTVQRACHQMGIVLLNSSARAGTARRASREWCRRSLELQTARSSRLNRDQTEIWRSPHASRRSDCPAARCHRTPRNMYRCARQSRTLWSVIEALQRQRSPRSIKRVTRPRLRESRWRGLRHHRQVLARARAVTGMLRNRAPRGSLPARMLLPASWLLSEPPIRSRGLLEACCSAHLNGTRCPAPPHVRWPFRRVKLPRECSQRQQSDARV